MVGYRIPTLCRRDARRFVDRMVAAGFGGAVENARRTDFSDNQYAPIATHGLVDSRDPTLSSLALSQVKRNRAGIASRLLPHDIHDMLLNASFVVLSAFETALGCHIHGDDLVGPMQGYFYSGARSLVVSLWQMPGRATAVLTKRFHKLSLTSGFHPSETLREAQISLASKRLWRYPYFWAAFLYLGASSRTFACNAQHGGFAAQFFNVAMIK